MSAGHMCFKKHAPWITRHVHYHITWGHFLIAFPDFKDTVERYKQHLCGLFWRAMRVMGDVSDLKVSLSNDVVAVMYESIVWQCLCAITQLWEAITLLLFLSSITLWLFCKPFILKPQTRKHWSTLSGTEGWYIFDMTKMLTVRSYAN